MAFVSQSMKKTLALTIKPICKKYGVKATLAVYNHSTLVLNIKSGKIDFLESYNRLGLAESRPEHLPFQPETSYTRVNPYHYKRHFDGKALKFLQEVIPVMNSGNHDNSDIMTDFFDVGWYIDINIGKWDKPYVLEI